MYKRIGITTKATLTEKDEALREVIDIVKGEGVSIFLHKENCSDASCKDDHEFYTKETELDLLIVIGGDGTILRSVRNLHDMRIPVLSVNRGTVGFLAETELHELHTLLPELLKGKGSLEERSLLDVTVQRKGKAIFSDQALNEAVIAQGTIARLVDLHTSVNGQKLTSFHADGLIIATPTGSTAYSLAAGGPIVHPHLQATILTPINPHSFSQKPVVIPAGQDVSVEVGAKPGNQLDSDVVLTVDGQEYIHLEDGDTVTVSTAKDTVQFLRRSEDTFFRTLQEKLKWGERVD